MSQPYYSPMLNVTEIDKLIQESKTEKENSHMTTQIDEQGLENIAIGIVQQAKKDFIKGAKILYKHLKRIPEQTELLADKIHATLSNDKDVREMYDAWRFVNKDPYYIFENAGKNKVIDAWKFDAIVEYYQDLYVAGAKVVYMFGFKKKKKDLHELSDSTLKKYINDPKILADFIAARNYIFSIPEYRDSFDELNAIAYERSKNQLKSGRGRDYIATQRKMKREADKRKAYDLYKSGTSTKAIATYMGIQERCVKIYINEMES